MSTNVLRKLSIKTVSGLTVKGLRELAATGKGSPVPLLRLAGIARSFSTGETDNGEYVKFKGEFQAINLQTGETSVSPVVFLPAPVDGMLREALDKDEAGAGAQFGFDVEIVENETSSVGYEYRVKTLVEVKPSEPLKALMSSLPPPKIVGANAVEHKPEVTEQAPAATKDKAPSKSK